MSEIRRLTDDELLPFARIVLDAYPSIEISSVEELAQNLKRSLADDPKTSIYGLFRAGRLLGGMRFLDFTMKLLSIKNLVGGVGLIAVDLLHKKEHVAKELVDYFLQHYRERGAVMTTLYPFRPDFYRNMGFGYGTKMNRYRLKPASLPRGSSKSHVRMLNQEDQTALLECYHRLLERTHGLMERSEIWANRVFNAPGYRVIGVKQDGRITAYMIFNFKQGKTFLDNDIEVSEFGYETSDALSELLTFLHSQADQINEIVIDTQDEFFHHIPLDPRNGTRNILPSVYHETNAAGVGLMYRVIDTAGIFRALAEHNFNNQNCTLTISIRDSFLPANEGDITVTFTDGKARLLPGAAADAVIQLDVADFSSLIMGAIDFAALYRYGQATLSNPDMLFVINTLFHTDQKPICMTRF
ncbi:MAG: GNAT family N-acetyltransferase [Chloroflexales bacterium]|nr:GNAT family N-acetyltransferase [Chloroflexales bacterium]